jgi:hypothetical protein
MHMPFVYTYAVRYRIHKNIHSYIQQYTLFFKYFIVLIL